MDSADDAAFEELFVVLSPPANRELSNLDGSVIDLIDDPSDGELILVTRGLFYGAL